MHYGHGDRPECHTPLFKRVFKNKSSSPASEASPGRWARGLWTGSLTSLWLLLYCSSFSWTLKPHIGFSMNESGAWPPPCGSVRRFIFTNTLTPRRNEHYANSAASYCSAEYKTNRSEQQSFQEKYVTGKPIYFCLNNQSFSRGVRNFIFRLLETNVIVLCWIKSKCEAGWGATWTWKSLWLDSPWGPNGVEVACSPAVAVSSGSPRCFFSNSDVLESRFTGRCLPLHH